VASFSADIVQVINSQLGNDAATIEHLIAQVSGRAEDMTSEQRDRRSLARRILKAIEPMLEEALRKESEVNGRPYAQQIKEMDEALLSRRASLVDSVDVPMTDSVEDLRADPVVTGPSTENDVKLRNGNGTNAVAAKDNHVPVGQPGRPGDVENADTAAKATHLLGDSALAMTANTPPASMNGIKHEQHVNGDLISGPMQRPEPPTPPMSLQGVQSSVNQGGIPWYVAQFDPEGTTIYEERWTGPEVLREMSEELSEMDEDELRGLGAGNDLDAGDDGGLPPPPAAENGAVLVAVANASAKKRLAKKSSKRSRSGDWGTRSFRNRR